MLSMLIAGILFQRGIQTDLVVVHVNVRTDDCVSGGMQVEELTKDTIAVSQLSNGDITRGIRGADRVHGWCRIEAGYVH